MKKVLFPLLVSLFIVCASALRAENIGVPSECEDVMLQAFYWDSYKTQSSSDSKYGRTKWVDLLKDTAAINANFDLVWFPPSAVSTGGVGYYHTCLSNQDQTAWGAKSKLVELIAALHAGNTKCIADIVINHRGNKSSWVDFYPDNFGSYGTYQLKQEHICSGDEAFTDSSSPYKGSATHGAADTGTNDGGCRDLDHTNTYVQNWAKAYVQWMISEMKYDGFRYDMTLGYHGRYLSMYNEAAKPYISVSELWESISTQKAHLVATNYNTMIFDFQQKYELHKAIVGGSYGKLKKNSNSFRGQGLEKYAVTFIDNHDTFERDSYGSNQFGGQFCDLSKATVKANVLQAHAYILMMPGVPCVFYPHWKSYQEEINALIAIRKKAGIHSESAVLEESSAQYAYSATIQGHRGKVVLRLGKNRDMTVPEGYYKAADGDYYSVYLEYGAGIDEVPTTNDQRPTTKILRDGQLIIRVGDTEYNATGLLMK